MEENCGSLLEFKMLISTLLNTQNLFLSKNMIVSTGKTGKKFIHQCCCGRHPQLTRVGCFPHDNTLADFLADHPRPLGNSLTKFLKKSRF